MADAGATKQRRKSLPNRLNLNFLTRQKMEQSDAQLQSPCDTEETVITPGSSDAQSFNIEDTQSANAADCAEKVTEPSILFEDQRIAIAIDRSGSTWRGALGLELILVQRICGLLSARNEAPVQVLPWNHQYYQLISLPQDTSLLSSLTSTGGTDPRVLFSFDTYLQTLKECGIWFLLTDGKIDDKIVTDFALKTAHYGMHGTACVIIVFGSASNDLPGSCDISVGVSLYAVTPNCLFLFHDALTGMLYNIQAKGCFKELLQNPDAQPVLNQNTRWKDLPTVSLADIRKIKIPNPIEISRNEVALQEQLKVDIEQLYSGATPENDLASIINNDDNLKSVVMTEMSRGRGQQVQDWLQKQVQRMPTLTKERRDVDGQAQAATDKLLKRIREGDEGAGLEEARHALQKAHITNSLRFEGVRSRHEKAQRKVGSHNRQVQWAQSLGSDMNNCQRAGSIPSYNSNHISSNSVSFIPDDADTHHRLQGFAGNRFPIYSRDGSMTSFDAPKTRMATPYITKEPPRELFFPGFQIPSSKDNSSFVGRCMLCARDSILSLLTKAPPKTSTPNFPMPGSQSTLAFPLATGNFPELDIVSFFVSCNECALYLVRTSKSPYDETITDAIPLVPKALNNSSWHGVVARSSHNRFRKDDLSLLFVAILDRMILDNDKRPQTDIGKSGFHEAARWAKRDILNSTAVPSTLSSTFASGTVIGPTFGNLTSLLADKVLVDPLDPRNCDLFILRYPLPGFVVIAHIMHDCGAADNTLELLTLHRFLYHLTEAYFRNLEHLGIQAAHDLLTELLYPDNVEPTIVQDILPKKEPIATITPTMTLLHSSKLIDEQSLSSFKKLSAFLKVDTKGGPAIAVYLHYLRTLALDRSSPVDTFNAIKDLPAMIVIMKTPFDVQETLATMIIANMR